MTNNQERQDEVDFWESEQMSYTPEESDQDGMASMDESEREQKDIIICLNCYHLAHFHHDKQTGEMTDTCRKPGCYCQSFSPEICN